MTSPVVTLKSVKKDGSIDNRHVERAASELIRGGRVILPVDGLYGKVELYIPGKSPHEDCRVEHGEAVLISSYLMLDELAVIDKFRYDFLQRVWPGELTVLLKRKGLSRGRIPLRVPHSRYIYQIIEQTGKPLMFTRLHHGGKLLFNEKDIVTSFGSHYPFTLIISEFCRERITPTVVDLTGSDLAILAEGKLPDEEIKSLYFLGKFDDFQ